MVHPEVWPLYHGTDGSYDLDVNKHWDILGSIHGFRPRLPPFDLVIDLGASMGLVTEKLVMRRFAMDYIMVEAQHSPGDVFAARFGDTSWRDNFVATQSANWNGAVTFE